VREIKSHTAIRGIASLLVVVYHFREVLPENLNPDRFTQFFARGYLWVDCFFMLSGFILCHVYGALHSFDRRQFFVARFARIYPLHLATLLFLANVFVVLPLVSHQRFAPDWCTFSLNLLDVHAWGLLSTFDWNYPSWSISVEFAAYIVFPLICLGLRHARAIALTMMSAAFCVVLFSGRDHWERLALLRGLPMFFAGIVLFNLPHKPTISMQVIGAALVIVALHLGIDTLAEIAFGLIIYSSQFDTGPSALLSASPLQWLGERSYSIYMLHVPIKIAVNIAAPKLSGFALFFSLISMTILIGSFSFSFFEMPARKCIRDCLTRNQLPAL
jgi:peptidoglycan/LPS O-acetylase OafA/YrhL